jgi:hypothetical protein
VNVTELLTLRGPDARDPRTGAVATSRIVVNEVSSPAHDSRYYTVREWHGAHILREREFVCEGHATRDMLPQADAARTLARAWAAG